MSTDFASFDRRAGGWSVLAALVDSDGSSRHSYLATLSRREATTRDIADAVHLLCALHGSYPSTIDLAVANAVPEALPWLQAAAAAFADERALLARLSSAVGPIPSTPGQAESEAAVGAQRHALEMLARSDRAGCATGTAMALVLDWQALRPMFDLVADRLGLTIAAPALPIHAETETLAVALATRPAVERAMSFGAQQLLAQHRALWDLAEARKSARDRG